MLADQLERLKDHILDRWRREVRGSPEQAALVAHLGRSRRAPGSSAGANRENYCNITRRAVPGLEEDAIDHGQQRYQNGYSVVQLLREMQIFRRVLATMAYEIVHPDESVGADSCLPQSDHRYY